MEFPLRKVCEGFLKNPTPLTITFILHDMYTQVTAEKSCENCSVYDWWNDIYIYMTYIVGHVVEYHYKFCKTSAELLEFIQVSISVICRLIFLVVRLQDCSMDHGWGS